MPPRFAAMLRLVLQRAARNYNDAVTPGKYLIKVKTESSATASDNRGGRFSYGNRVSHELTLLVNSSPGYLINTFRSTSSRFVTGPKTRDKLETQIDRSFLLLIIIKRSGVLYIRVSCRSAVSAFLVVSPSVAA